MTLPQNVADAAAEVDAWLSGESVHADWQTIRAHLMRQEAEIARLTSRSESAERDSRDYRQIQIEDSVRAELAESRLAAANALLREIMEFGEDRKLHTRIQSHLQGAGDEA